MDPDRARLYDVQAPEGRPFLWRVLVAGGVFFAGGLFLLPDIWTTETSLTAFRGRIRRCDAYTETTTERSRGSSGRKAFLVCYLQGSTREFQLREPLDESESLPPAYELLRSQLEQASTATFWVRTADTAADAPKLFRIDAGSETVLPLADVTRENQLPAAILLGLGLLGLGWASRHLFPGTWRKLGF